MNRWEEVRPRDGHQPAKLSLRPVLASRPFSVPFVWQRKAHPDFRAGADRGSGCSPDHLYKVLDGFPDRTWRTMARVLL